MDSNDIFNINVTASVGNKSVYYEDDITNINSTTYGKFLLRYKTSDSSIKAKVELVFTSGTQTILAETSNTAWTVASGTITTAKTVDKVRLYATQATGDVYYDFVLLHEGTFTFPHVGPGGVSTNYPMKLVEIPMLDKEGDVLQRLGMGSPTITLKGDVLQGETWESGSTVPHFNYVLRGFLADEWEYFTCAYPRLACQVVYKDFKTAMESRGDESVLTWELTLKLLKQASFSDFLNYDWVLME